MYCEFGELGLVEKVIRVEHKKVLCRDDKQFLRSGQSNHELMSPECRTNYTIYTCKAPYTTKIGQVSVEIMDQFGTFTKTILG